MFSKIKLFASSGKEKIHYLKYAALSFVILGALASSVYKEPVKAGTLSLSSEPLATSSGLSVKPNLLFILDNSGSMAWHYTPDYLETVNMCKNADNSGKSLAECTPGDPTYASTMNAQYYNPAIQYYPPKDATGADFADATPTAAIISPFLTSGSAQRTVNLTTSYPETYWCKSSSDVPTTAKITLGDCVKHNNGENYIYPNATYKYKSTNAYWCKNTTDVPPSANCVRAFYNSGNGDWENDSNDWGYSNTYSYFKTVSITAPYYYNLTIAPQWCDYSSTTGEYTNCKDKRNPTQIYPKYVSSSPAINGVRATASMTIANYTNTNNNVRTVQINSVTVNGVNLLNAAISRSFSKNQSYSGNQQALDIITQINNKTSSTGFSAAIESSGSRTLIITAPYSVSGTNSDKNTDFNGDSISTSGSNFTVSSKTNFSGGVNYVPAVTGQTFTKVEIVPTTTSYPKGVDRTDCTGATCTYAQELQNFANWFQYYKTRMDMMKSATSRVFAQVSDTSPGIGFRVGFRLISSKTASEVAIADFNSTQKSTFFTTLFSIVPSSSTTLRGALSEAGRLYGGKHTYDPIQQSCQQNFTFLSTDGYWNTSGESTSYGPFVLNSNTNVGNQDGSTEGWGLPYTDASNLSNTLADVAAYYWKTDLRGTMTDNVPTSARDSANWQHMVTFTMGLGIPGNLTYAESYLTGGSSDYNNLVNGVSGFNWGNPITNTAESRIDDLWHAAVNGRGIYFAASNPSEIANSLITALNSAAAITGSGAAAATSNLEPVAGDNYAYTASYTTKDWVGNLKAQTIDLTTGAIDGTTTLWEAQPLLDSKASAGTRVLYTMDKALTTEDKKVTLNWSTINTKGWSSYFNPGNLSQCIGTFSVCSGHTNQNLFEYLVNAGTNPSGSYRGLISRLGDIVNSQPVYVGSPQFGYQDTGYSGYQSTHANRAGIVFVGANDGFLHAFDAVTGEEKWAYAPFETLNKMYKIADYNYSGNHQYFVDGKITVGDVWDGSSWRTILVSGLGAGGKAYFAMDITNPLAPKALWEFTNGELGFTFGNPIISKLSDGSWSVIVSSGYNSTAKGKLFVLNPITGALKYSVQASASTNDSGLAKIANWVTNPQQDNTTQWVYGGDLDGKIWKFTLGASSGSVTQFAALGEPITTKPTIAAVTGTAGATIPAVLQGTGKFLEVSDKADSSKRSVYALKDDGTVHSAGIKSSGDYVRQTLSVATSTTRTSTNNNMDWSTKKGWWVEFLDDGERVNVDPKLQLNTFVVPTNVPSLTPTACSAGGYSWLNYFDVLTGSYVKSTSSNPSLIASTKLSNALVVGINIVKLPNGKLISIITTSDNSHPVSTTPSSGGGGSIKRVSWRELVGD